MATRSVSRWRPVFRLALDSAPNNHPARLARTGVPCQRSTSVRPTNVSTPVTPITIPIPCGVPSWNIPTATLASAPSANCTAPNTAAAAPALCGYRCIRSVVQLADNNPTTPTTKNRQPTIDHNPPNPVMQTNAVASAAITLTNDAIEISFSDPSDPTSRVFTTFQPMIPIMFRPKKNP